MFRHIFEGAEYRAVLHLWKETFCNYNSYRSLIKNMFHDRQIELVQLGMRLWAPSIFGLQDEKRTVPVGVWENEIRLAVACSVFVNKAEPLSVHRRRNRCSKLALVAEAGAFAPARPGLGDTRRRYGANSG